MLDLAESQAYWIATAVLAVLFLLLRAVTQDEALRKDFRGTALVYWWGLPPALLGTALAPFAREGSKYLFVFSLLLFGIASMRGAGAVLLYLLRGRKGVQTPKIVHDAIFGLLYGVAVVSVLRATLHIDLTSVLATSAVLSVVIGLALQETLGNLFAGLSLQVERPFQVGDWVTIGSHTGQVAQIAWRATRLETSRMESITLPNNVIGKEAVINYSRSPQGIAHDLKVGIAYEVPPNAARAAILQALHDVPAVLRAPPPRVRLLQFLDSSVEYQVRFYVRSFEEVEGTAGEVRSALWYKLRRRGFDLPFPQRVVTVQRQGRAAEKRPTTERNVTQSELALLAGVDFLRPLGEEGLKRIASFLESHLFGTGETIIRQGEPGDTFYLVAEGEVSVRAKTGGAESEIARMGPGSFFGEMSLLTGDARSATVVAATDAVVLSMSREPFGQVLTENPRMAEELSEILARRRGELKAAQAGAASPAEITRAESKRIFDRLRDLFKVRPAAGT